MNTLSSTESYVLSILDTLKDKAALDLDNLTSMLLGFYICTILDPVEQIKENDLIDTIENLQKGNTLLHALEKEKNLNFLNIKKETLFDNFILNNAEIKNTLKDLIVNNISTKKALSAFNQKIITAFGVKKKKYSRYEVRFFWPSPAHPEVYDLYGLIFNKKDYTPIITTDKYILTKNNINIKIRKDELQIKKCIQTISLISCFKKKKKIPFPIKAKK